MTRHSDRMLAEDFIAQPTYKLGNKLIDSTLFVPIVKQASKFVLDEEATRMVVRLSSQQGIADPEHMALMANAAWPAADHVWIELPSEFMLKERELINPAGQYWHKVDGVPYEERKPHHRMAVFAHKRDDQSMIIHCVEHFVGSAKDEVFSWPLGFLFHKSPTEGKQDAKTLKALWGYGSDATHLDHLRGRAHFTLHPGFVMTDPEFSTHVRELLGFLRLSVAALAILNTVAEVSASNRPPGQFIGKGGRSHPRQTRSFVTIKLPKRIKDPVAYVRRKFALHSRKLHDVSAHYRHLPYPPNAPGWEYVDTHLGPRWRKPIPKHMRGNIELGVVEHKGHLVKA
jgi:hypothetical protein